MTELDARVFASLFADAYRKCFSRPFAAPLTEAESMHFSVDIAESTGLEIGWKSLKNYSQFLADTAPSRRENPSTSTLETLARYVAGAPVADPEDRKGQRHYPYWFRYREAWPPTAEPLIGRRGDDLTRADVRRTDSASPAGAATGAPRRRLGHVPVLAGVVAIAALSVVAIAVARHRSSSGTFADEFDDVSDAALVARGWHVQSLDEAHWLQRARKAGHLTLFTLSGDSWPQPGRGPRISNLLVRRAPPDCFVAEVRFTSFLPRQNWQQAGLLLLEDTAFSGRSLRVSVGYNDFAGGFASTREVHVQAISSLGQGFSKPEELAHYRLFVLEPGMERTVAENLASVALRIERHRHRFRLLYSAGPMANAAFREVASSDFDMRPAFIGIFALRGFVDRGDMPVYVDGFRMRPEACDD